MSAVAERVPAAAVAIKKPKPVSEWTIDDCLAEENQPIIAALTDEELYDLGIQIDDGERFTRKRVTA